jgi:hypothetical protein
MVSDGQQERVFAWNIKPTMVSSPKVGQQRTASSSLSHNLSSALGRETTYLLQQNLTRSTAFLGGLQARIAVASSEEHGLLVAREHYEAFLEYAQRAEA